MEGQFITNKELILSGIINYQYVKSNLYRTIAKDENKKSRLEAVDKLKIWPKDKVLFKDLMSIYNEGFTKTNLYSYRQFYKIFPQIFHAVSGKSALYFRGHITECLRLLYVSGIGCDGVSGGAVKG